MLKALVVLLAALATGCASTIPEHIRKAPPNEPSIAAVRSNLEANLGLPVRWGGEVETIDNQQEETWLEIVSRTLNRQGKPLDGNQTHGRFLAKIPGFLDPAVYSPGRLITVVGLVDGETSRTIGNFQYHYPVILVEHHYLWREEESVVYVHDPFYDPYFPYWYYRPYPYPYRYYPRHHPRHTH